MAFEIDIGFTSQAGAREVNEDFCGAMLPSPAQADMGAIAAVADGVSHGGMGREAAQTTVISLLRDYYGTPETWNTTVALDRVISAQNAWLAGINRRRIPALGMSTLTALVIKGQSYALAHVGDTRAYLLRDGELIQLTQDHVVQHPDFHHQLLRAIGYEDRVAVDYEQGDAQVGDVFVLLTDGVHGSLDSKRIRETVLSHNSSQLAAQALIDAARKASSQDNVTALVLRVIGLLDASLSDESQSLKTLPIPPRLQVGSVIDGLSVTALVADNGVNLLYQVRDLASQKLFALKTLNPSRANDPQEREMLAHEAWLAKRMRSSSAADYLVTLHDELPGKTPRSACFLLYDWHRGETCAQWLAHKGPLQVPQLLGLATQALKGLMLLHRQGVVHRDINPTNLHQGEDGVLRILDLGVALSGRESQSARELHAGTPSYVNPEQWGFSIKGGDMTAKQLPDARSDLFALGVTLYQLLTGRLPYGQVLPYQIGRYHRDPVPPSRHRPEIPIWLDHVILKAVARDQSQRFETGEEFLLALERGAARPLPIPQNTPLLLRSPSTAWKLAFAVSMLFNLLLIYWLLFLPK
ncbi:bifunctional protein-serine/threonine kinase/phosphatase [Rhodoferax sp. GW822-FHT02A01]|uniref:bifunctional protein-serine/threonine kinase/phosphatase n=1 Tax=Rhodoferax sp. GW822-FHT02A01 TaxID=3141537 RepID=UPI00315CCFB5